MALISIRKFLDNGDKDKEPAGCTQPGCHEPGCTMVCSDLHSLILQHAYPAESLGSAPDNNILVAARSSYEHRDELVHELSEGLRARRTSDQSHCHRQAQELHNLFSILNNALTSLARGSETSVAHLKQVETQLSRASLIKDMASLKSTLNNTVILLRQESERRQRESGEELSAFEEAYRQARLTAAAALASPAGRDAACQALRQPPAPGQPPLIVVACVFERLRMLEGRFGASAAEDLVRSFARTMVASATPAPDIYYWSREMLVWTARPPLPATEARAFWETRLNQPFEFRTLAGGRSVLLSVNCRWMCSSIPPDDPSVIIDEVDQFRQGGRHRW